MPINCPTVIAQRHSSGSGLRANRIRASGVFGSVGSSVSVIVWSSESMSLWEVIFVSVLSVIRYDFSNTTTSCPALSQR